MEDFRKADPKYYGFVPKTASEAIDLFFRLKRNGMHAEHHPEAFVWCTRALPNEEGAKFEDWLVAPQGISATAPLYTTDPAVEAERRFLEKDSQTACNSWRSRRMPTSPPRTPPPPPSPR